jgi:hypothetical protein
MENPMFNGDRLNDADALHQRRFAHITKDELDILVADAQILRPRWYNGILARFGDGLIKVGSSIKENNSGVKSPDLSVSMR